MAGGGGDGDSGGCCLRWIRHLGVVQAGGQDESGQVLKPFRKSHQMAPKNWVENSKL